MPANTSHGYPYPLGTDRVADGDDVIHSLADSINLRAGALASGVATIPITAAATSATVTVTFPAGRFLAAPAVCISVRNGQVGNDLRCVAYNVTATGFTAGGYRTTGTAAYDTAWIAIDQS